MIRKFLNIFFVLFFLFSAKSVSAKDYSIISADFKVQLNSDGSADVTEIRTYFFDGSYSWIGSINRSKVKNSSQKSKGGRC